MYARFSAVRWVALAWEKVKPETISKCFRKAGVLQDATMDVVAHTHHDMILKMILFWSQMHAWSSRIFSRKLCLYNSEQRCSLAEYLRGEEEVPVRVDMDGEDWDANFIAQLVDGDEGGDEDDMDVDEEPVSKFK